MDNKPCSVLEMMIALALRCEEHIMYDPEEGYKTNKWFWIMIENLGVGNMTNSHFETEYADFKIERFLNREYSPNGEGGLFKIENCRRDLRNAEIWYQAMWYLSEVFERR